MIWGCKMKYHCWYVQKLLLILLQNELSVCIVEKAFSWCSSCAPLWFIIRKAWSNPWKPGYTDTSKGWYHISVETGVSK